MLLHEGTRYMDNQHSDAQPLLSPRYMENQHSEAQPGSLLSPPSSDREILSDYHPEQEPEMERSVDPLSQLVRSPLTAQKPNPSMKAMKREGSLSPGRMPQTEVSQAPRRRPEPDLSLKPMTRERLVPVARAPHTLVGQTAMTRHEQKEEEAIEPMQPIEAPMDRDAETAVDPMPEEKELGHELETSVDPQLEFQKEKDAGDELENTLPQPNMEKSTVSERDTTSDPGPELEREPRKQEQVVGSDGTVTKPATANKCFNWFGMNLDPLKIPTAEYGVALGPPWGEMKNNICNSGLTQPYGAYSCWAKTAHGSLKPCGRNVNCVAGVCVKEQNLLHKWSAVVASRQCNGKLLTELTGDAQDRSEMDCKILCESLSTCTGFNVGKDKCSLFSSFTSETSCDSNSEYKVHFVTRI
jgi:hypothetical protein